jgi:hypothetical protein
MVAPSVSRGIAQMIGVTALAGIRANRDEP